MIVPMKKVTVLCLAHDQEAALKKIRDLGVLHVEIEQLADSNDRTELQTLSAGINKVYGALSARTEIPLHHGHIHAGRDIYQEADKQLRAISEVEKELGNRRRTHEALAPWGDFSPELVKELEAGGVHVYLCAAPKNIYEQFAARDDMLCQAVTESKHEVCFALIARQEIDRDSLPLANLPESAGLKELEAEIIELQHCADEINAELDKLAEHLEGLENYRNEVAEQLEFVTNLDGMDNHEQINSIKGFVPEPEEDNLTAAAAEHGWALLTEKPAAEDCVPTLITIPKIFRFIQPLFEFLGISPGYNEIDVSIGVLFFFTIFFSMILGDAGYGSLFLIGTVTAGLLLKNPKYKLGLRLMMTLSIATIIWGGLNGNWFGISVPGLKLLTNPKTSMEVRNSYIMFFCFILAIAQLSMGHIWQAIVHGKLHKALGQLGWIMILWGNFFLTLKLIVFPGPFPAFMYWLYIPGLILTVLFDIDWKNIGAIFNYPFSIIGSFVDILSYIRLFAVGMAGFYIASSFNGMAVGLFTAAAPIWAIPLTIIVGVVVLLFGHILNIALCMMGVLVHGVRLNTLEFSNHVGLTWSGIEFKPFKKINHNEGETSHGK